MTASSQRAALSLHREVRRAGGRLHPDAAARALLRSPGTVTEAGRRVILSLARSDPRLSVDDRGWLVLSSPPHVSLPLDRVEFVVVDVETTGSTPDVSRITEVGAFRVRGGRLRDSFHRLVDPGVAVPRGITRLTGIDARTLAGAPPFGRIAVEWLDFLGNAVLVAHNAPFDRGFLDSELLRCGEDPPSNLVLCTVRLARRMLPGLRTHDLDSLAEHLELTFRERHRALGDAEVTAHALIRLLEHAAARGVRSLGQMQKMLERPVAGAAPRRPAGPGLPA